MAIKIDLPTAIIEFEIGNFKFAVDMTDKKEKEFKAKLEDFLQQIEQLDGHNEEDEAKLRVMLEVMYDELFGSGAFEKLYKHTANIGVLSGVFINIVTELVKEMQSRIISAPVLKALEKKVKKSMTKKPGTKK